MSTTIKTGPSETSAREESYESSTITTDLPDYGFTIIIKATKGGNDHIINEPIDLDINERDHTTGKLIQKEMGDDLTLEKAIELRDGLTASIDFLTGESTVTIPRALAEDEAENLLSFAEANVFAPERRDYTSILQAIRKEKNAGKDDSDTELAIGKLRDYRKLMHAMGEGRDLPDPEKYLAGMEAGDERQADQPETIAIPREYMEDIAESYFLDMQSTATGETYMQLLKYAASHIYKTEAGLDFFIESAKKYRNMMMLLGQGDGLPSPGEYIRKSKKAKGAKSK